jgi:hypothetical protein
MGDKNSRGLERGERKKGVERERECVCVCVWCVCMFGLVRLKSYEAGVNKENISFVLIGPPPRPSEAARKSARPLRWSKAR